MTFLSSKKKTGKVKKRKKEIKMKIKRPSSKERLKETEKRRLRIGD